MIWLQLLKGCMYTAIQGIKPYQFHWSTYIIPVQILFSYPVDNDLSSSGIICYPPFEQLEPG